MGIRKHILGSAVAAILCVFFGSVMAAEVKLALPLVRTAYQTNETIPVAVERTAAEALPATILTVTLTREDGSNSTFAFPVQAAEAVNGKAATTEHLNFAGQLLRPGRYTVEVGVDGATGTVVFDLASHIRRSSYKLINWGDPNVEDPIAMQAQGEWSLGYNQMYTHSSVGKDTRGDFLRAGVDHMDVCTMSGGHQMDLRSECDWSDPYVLQGGSRRVAREAMITRLRGNGVGVNFYDEPGLTWSKHPDTGEWTPHGIPAQRRSYEAAMNREAIQYNKVDPANAETLAAWKEFATWKLSFMESAWQDAAFAVAAVSPSLISATQSQYGWSAFTDGYYFNIARPLSVTSGHGGYDDFGPGYFNPSFTLEFARARDLARANWYLPTWYRNIDDDLMRLEQYLSFQVGIQGIMTPPWIEPTGKTPSGRQGIVECNQLMGRLGTIFHTMKPARPEVAVLYSMSTNIAIQTGDMTQNYAHGNRHGSRLNMVYLAGKMAGQPLQPVVEEDLLDGTLAAHHKAVLLTCIDELPASVTQALEQFAVAGGKVLLIDSKVKVAGSIDLGVATPKLPDEDCEAWKAAVAIKKWEDLAPFQTVSKWVEGATPLAKALRLALDKAGIAAPLTAEGGLISVTKQGEGDIDYLFAVNATPDAGPGTKNAIKAITTKLTIPAGGRSLYDAMTGGAVKELTGAAPAFSGSFRLGAGEMRVFALTARPIGSVALGTPSVLQDLTLTESPIRLRLAATLLDSKGGLLSGSAPMRVVVTDPQGSVRYDLHRATAMGVLALELPLAANDAAGSWTVQVSELLNGQSASSSFVYAPPARNGGIAGTTRRAIFFAADEVNIYRYMRNFQQVTIVPGSSPLYAAAAERLIKVLAPWGVRATVLPLDEAVKARNLTAEEATTWVGLNFAGKGQIKPGSENNPMMSGYALQGPAILLGTPEDHPMIKAIQAERFLPYAPSATFPGAGRGYIAWQREAIGPRQESITLIAYDEAGLNEAVGTLYEITAGMKPLTRWEQPVSASTAPAEAVAPVAQLKETWSVDAGDRVLGIKVEGGTLSVLTNDGALSSITAAGKLSGTKALDAAAFALAVKEEVQPPLTPEQLKALSVPGLLLKQVIAAAAGSTLASYWGGTLRLTDAQGQLLAQNRLPADVTTLVLAGNQAIAGLVDGRVIAVEVQ